MVRSALSGVDGVVSATVGMTSAVVVVDRSRVTDAQLINAVQGAGDGFNATVK